MIVASQNQHKLKEIEHILGVKVHGANIKVKEDGKTFEENAIKKAKAGLRKFKELTLADDSGLEVKCLGGKPGVKSARYATPPTPENLCNKLLRAMKDGKDRRAQFVCVIALAYPNGKVKTFKGVVKGRIIEEMRGSHGFGYDPVFVPDGYQKTFAEMKPATKNHLSHRGQALKKISRL
ncbi:MAG: RdgB/HAM1 family non-canonical purine NTP pyrophosphatase [Candidatus Margulisbacteria bacterium]|nr:RdgB/HAM1 family non-canonical purine NTP pyrophosphatase [Candidatus Margulisiibacteriota bacterium]